ncbi:MAG: hypothetical protein JWM95_2643 [Gemmatimonadetes bacterium]|nr:hypothetical protein [Gemmatimonadota bacterium]
MRKYYDKNDGLDSLARWMLPNPNNVLPLVTRWTDDYAGRKVSERAPRQSLPQTSTAVLPLGTITAPAQVDSFTYDLMGRMIGAFNPFSRVVRSITRVAPSAPRRRASPAGTGDVLFLTTPLQFAYIWPGVFSPQFWILMHRAPLSCMDQV